MLEGLWRSLNEITVLPKTLCDKFNDSEFSQLVAMTARNYPKAAQRLVRAAYPLNGYKTIVHYELPIMQELRARRRMTQEKDHYVLIDNDAIVPLLPDIDNPLSKDRTLVASTLVMMIDGCQIASVESVTVPNPDRKSTFRFPISKSLTKLYFPKHVDAVLTKLVYADQVFG